jgi:hypothetical protein
MPPTQDPTFPIVCRRVPAVVIRIELEAVPQLYLEVMTEGEELRLVDWVNGWAELRELVERALELRDAECEALIEDANKRRNEEGS